MNESFERHLSTPNKTLLRANFQDWMVNASKCTRMYIDVQLKEAEIYNSWRKLIGFDIQTKLLNIMLLSHMVLSFSNKGIYLLLTVTPTNWWSCCVNSLTLLLSRYLQKIRNDLSKKIRKCFERCLKNCLIIKKNHHKSKR